MAIALVATIVLLPKTPTPARTREAHANRSRRCRHRALATTSVVGLLYNWGFFTLLGYSPFLMGDHSPQQLGLVFCGWGVLVAVFAVWGAPWLKARFGTARTLYGNFVLMAVDLAVIGIWPDSKTDRHRRGDRRRRVHRREQHAGHDRGHEHRAGRAAGRLGDLRLRPVHRRRPRAVRRGQARRALQPARAVRDRRRRRSLLAAVLLSTVHSALAARRPRARSRSPSSTTSTGSSARTSCRSPPGSATRADRRVVPSVSERAGRPATRRRSAAAASAAAAACRPGTRRLRPRCASTAIWMLPGSTPDEQRRPRQAAEAPGRRQRERRRRRRARRRRRRRSRCGASRAAVAGSSRRRSSGSRSATPRRRRAAPPARVALDGADRRALRHEQHSGRECVAARVDTLALQRDDTPPRRLHVALRRRGARGSAGTTCSPASPTSSRSASAASPPCSGRARSAPTGMVALKLLNVRDASPRVDRVVRARVDRARRAELAPEHRHAVPHVPDRRTGVRCWCSSCARGAVADRHPRRRGRAGAPKRSRSASRSPARSRPRTAAGSCTATSSRRTSWSPSSASRRWPTSAWRCCSRPPRPRPACSTSPPCTRRPELLEGGGTSAATDVYELASSLYQLIAGKSAFRAYEGESPASVILRILRDPVRPLSGVDVPMALSDLLIRAMSKQMDERPPTAAEFAAELADVEIAQGWHRTQFLIRDPGPLGAGIAARGHPDAGRRAARAALDARAVAAAGPARPSSGCTRSWHEPPPTPSPPSRSRPEPEADWSSPTLRRVAGLDAAARRRAAAAGRGARSAAGHLVVGPADHSALCRTRPGARAGTRSARAGAGGRGPDAVPAAGLGELRPAVSATATGAGRGARRAATRDPTGHPATVLPEPVPAPPPRPRRVPGRHRRRLSSRPAPAARTRPAGPAVPRTHRPSAEPGAVPVWAVRAPTPATARDRAAVQLRPLPRPDVAAPQGHDPLRRVRGAGRRAGPAAAHVVPPHHHRLVRRPRLRGACRPARRRSTTTARPARVSSSR